ncbi:hypothetical protein [Xanthomonas sacchari]|nr:hypothetical protein [Xanthomonas sacchari]
MKRKFFASPPGEAPLPESPVSSTRVKKENGMGSVTPEALEALRDLRVGVELDQHNVPNAALRLRALDAAIELLAAQAEWPQRRAIVAPKGWSICMPDGSESVLVSAPEANPGAMWVNNAGRLEQRILYALARDLAAGPPLCEGPMRKQHERGYWVIECPVITTAHLTYEAAEILAQTLPGEDFFGAPCMIGSHGGAIGCSDAVRLDGCAPKCVRDVISWGRHEGFDWIRLDADGDQIGELTVYDH